MANADKTLQDKDYVNIYPITRERNVYDENNVNLKEKLKNVVFNDNEVFKFSQEQYEESANLYNKDSDIIGKSLDGNTGELTTNSSAFTSDYINVEGLDNVYVSGNRTASPSFVFYDKNKSYLSTQKIYYTGILNVPSDAKYLRFNGLLTEREVMINAGTKALPYQPYNAKYHITNSEAEFLKDEHEKQINLMSEEVIDITGYNVAWGYIYGLKPNTTYTFKTYAGYIGGSNLKLETKDGTLVQDVVTDWSLNLQNQVAKFTTGNNVSENGIYRLHLVGTYSDSTVTRDCMLVEGDYTFDTMPSYVPYNSSSHITNGQAKSLIPIYEKWVNALHLPEMEETRISGALCSIEKDKFNINGTLTSNFWLSLVLPHPVPAGNYYFKTFNANGLAPSYFGFIFYDKDGNSLGSYDARFKHSKPITFDKEVAKIGFGANSGSTFNNLSIEIMFAKDNIEPSRFYEWNGDPIFTKDIEPVTLFEGTSNGDINLRESILNFENIEIWYGYSGSLYSVKLNTKLIDIGGSVKLLQPTGDVSGSNTGISFRLNSYSIAENKLTYEYSVRFYSYANGSPTVDTNNNVFIKKVLGFKY